MNNDYTDHISRWTAINAIYEHEFSNWCDKDEVSTILNDLPSIEPADASELIRCKDCKYVERARSEEAARKFGQIYICGRHVFPCPKPDDYCSWAERRTDG